MRQEVGDMRYKAALINLTFRIKMKYDDRYDLWKEAGKMSEAVERVFRKEIEEAAQKKEEQVITAMLQNHEPADKIVQYFGWTPEKVMTFVKNWCNDAYVTVVGKCDGGPSVLLSVWSGDWRAFAIYNEKVSCKIKFSHPTLHTSL